VFKPWYHKKKKKRKEVGGSWQPWQEQLWLIAGVRTWVVEWA
jgi:hypothetical protein